MQRIAQWTWPDRPGGVVTVAALRPASGEYIAYLLRDPDFTVTAATLEAAEQAILDAYTRAHMDNPSSPTLRPLHPDSGLSAKLDRLERQTTDQVIQSLRPGQPHSLKARPDGTILDGHHRIFVLRSRGVDVDALPREVLDKKRIS